MSLFLDAHPVSVMTNLVRVDDPEPPEDGSDWYLSPDVAIEYAGRLIEAACAARSYRPVAAR